MGRRGPGARTKNKIESEATDIFSPRSWDDDTLPLWKRIILFAESLPITSGVLAGQNLRLRPWQKAFIKAVYRTVRGKRQVRTALLTMGRKNGKTALAAVMALAHLCGPAVEERGQIYSCASDRPQAGLIYAEMDAIIQRVPWMQARCNAKDFYKTITDDLTGSIYQAMSSDARKAHGLSPSFVVCDELAQWRGRALYDNMVSGTGARKEPLIVAIGTQSHEDTNIMSELVDYGQQINSGEIKDPSFHASIYSAPMDADPWHFDTWKLANPALGDFRSLEEMETAAAQAQKIPAREAIFRNLYLNQRIDANPRFIAPADWTACGGLVESSELYGRPCWCGLDLSSTTDLSTFVAYFPEDNGALLAYFWLPGDDLLAREDKDKVPYRVWREKGYLALTPGRSIDKAFIAHSLVCFASDFNIQGIAYDRWRMADLKKLLSDEGTDLPLVDFGQGFKDMAPAVDELERLVLAGRINHGHNPILTWNCSNVAVESDPAGNRKFNKRRATGRIDGMVALAMAVGLCARESGPKAYHFDPETPLWLNF